MDALKKKDKITVDDIISCLDNERSRKWVILKAGKICRQYPFLFDTIYDGKYVKGYKRKRRFNDRPIID